MTTDITELAQSLKAAADREMISRDAAETSNAWQDNVTPENILALVEALEKSDSRLHEVAVACATAEQALEKAQQRIIQLESRTVKLPKLKMLEDYLAEVAIEERKAILNSVRMEFHRALTAAGIKWEGE